MEQETESLWVKCKNSLYNFRNINDSSLDLTAQNLDKKDLFSESDPFYCIYRTSDDGSRTLVYRSEWIKVRSHEPWLVTDLKLRRIQRLQTGHQSHWTVPSCVWETGRDLLLLRCLTGTVMVVMISLAPAPLHWRHWPRERIIK